MKNLRNPWWEMLIVKLMGRRISLSTLTRRLEAMWSRQGSIEKPDFNSEKAEIDKIAAWVRLLGLAIEYYEEQMLRRIGNIIGRTLRVNTYTVEKCRGKFARLCVELDLNELLVAQYAINEVRYLVEYEGIHNICFACRMVRHKKQRCPKKIQNKPLGSTEQQHARMNQEGERMENQQSREEDRGKKGKGKEVQEEQREAFGLWIIVQKTTRGRKTVKEGAGTVSGVDEETSENGKKVVSGMKFAILNDEEATNAMMVQWDHRSKIWKEFL
ncbi:uncharacterized protein LOC130945416 [Arachis stenosperma]|uniref:uncharacterized protein LOC130945416 n=1 Tax=Arachis stenosperma TaxID=217475 RepID=UPI0025ACC2E3|nr:uncharacterized protein LOC130945416 [Arachis stenosperma]